jgi:hypothetical protein
MFGSSWRCQRFVSHCQANRIAFSCDRFPDAFATVAWASKTVAPRRFDMVHTLVKSVADEVCISGSLGAKANARQLKACFPQPAHFRPPNYA